MNDIIIYYYKSRSFYADDHKLRDRYFVTSRRFLNGLDLNTIESYLSKYKNETLYILINNTEFRLDSLIKLNN